MDRQTDRQKHSIQPTSDRQLYALNPAHIEEEEEGSSSNDPGKVIADLSVMANNNNNIDNVLNTIIIEFSVYDTN